MSTRKKNNSIKKLDKIRSKPLVFSELLHSIRTTEEMSQVDLAEACGTSKAKICDFEKGRRLPTLELGAKFAKALGHSEALFVAKLIEEQIREANLDLKVSIEAA
jgi:transcriptional regulator with XRE-family HTH domain